MTLSCYIVDDQPHVSETLTYLIRQTEGLELLGSEQNPIVALNKVVTGTIFPEILFLDIDMPDMDGLELSRRIAGDIIIIFVTGHAKHALEAFDIGAADYLLKPFSTAAFLRAIERAKERINARSKKTVLPGFIFVKLDSRNLTQVVLAELAWVSVDDKYVQLHVTGNKKPLVINNRLNHIEECLPDDLFVRIGKSCIVNLSHVENVVGNQAMLKGGKMLEVSRTYLQHFYSKLNAI